MDIGTKFKFMIDNARRIYTATQVGRGSTMWHVTWPEMRAGGTSYSNAQVIDALRSGAWQMVAVEQSLDPQAQIKRLLALAAKGVTTTFRADGTVVIENGQWQFRSNEPEYIESCLKRAEASVG